MNKAMSGNKRKPSITVGLILLILFLYGGYCIGVMDSSGDLSAKDWGTTFFYYFTHPFPLLFKQKSLMWIGVGCACALVCWIYYAVNVNSRIAGREYGTARFENPKVLSKKLAFKDTSNKVLSKNMAISTDDRRTGLNNNLLLIGGSGAGKSYRFVKPNILQCNGSMIITDPKGELIRDTGEYLKQHGYSIKVVNLVEPLRSDRYNPLAYIRKQDDVVKLVNILLKNTTPKNANVSDPFWEKAESLYLQSLFFYVWLHPKMEGRRNLGSVIGLMSEASVPENEKEKSALDIRMDELLKTEWELKDLTSGKIRRYPGIDHPAYKTYKMVRSGAVDTVRSILISANSRMGFLLNSPELRDMLSADDMDISSLGMDSDKKTALFCIIPDSDKTYNAVAGMLYSQIFQELYFQADNNTKTGRLPVSVSFWFDEFANIAMPNDFVEMLATMRSRGISANIIIQNLAQLKSRYRDDWETITGNCDTLIYLGGNEQSTHKYISEMLGKWTVEKRSTSSSSGRNGNTSRSDDVLGRELMTPDEVRMMPNKMELVIIRGAYPVIDEKYQTEKTPVFKDANSLGFYQHPFREMKPSSDYGGIRISMTNQYDYNGMTKAITTTLAQLRRLDPLEKDNGSLEYEYTLSGIAQELPDGQQSFANDSIKDRMKKYDFTDEQLQEAVLASADGLSEVQILEWFVPENSAKKMELSRKMQQQESYKSRIMSAGRK